jgi:hypothetical protein
LNKISYMQYIRIELYCQQDVFALLVPSMLTTCYKVVELNRLVTSCSNNLLSSCNPTTCQQVASDNLVATWWNNSIVTTCWQACYTSMWWTHLVDKLWVTTLQQLDEITALLQLVDKLATSLLRTLLSSCWQVVRFLRV